MFFVSDIYTIPPDKFDIPLQFDKDVASEEWYGCSDSTTTSYMKIKAAQIIHDFLSFVEHRAYAVYCRGVIWDCT